MTPVRPVLLQRNKIVTRQKVRREVQIHSYFQRLRKGLSSASRIALIRLTEQRPPASCRVVEDLQHIEC
eukprot:1834687-Pleurochrysis_carterae.AAC.2